MKKILSIILLLSLIISLSACQNKTNSSNDDTNQVKEKTDNTTVLKGKVLITYFTFPETDGVDASSSASRVIDKNKVVGATEYIAHIISNNTNGDLIQIETEQSYPGTHSPLVEQASKEQSDDARPILKTKLDNINEYDIIFIGYPNWWGDMPMPLYTFLDEYDLSSKTIIPFCTHGGSGLSSTIESIQELEPNATVIENALSISRNDVADSKNKVIQWIKDLNIEK